MITSVARGDQKMYIKAEYKKALYAAGFVQVARCGYAFERQHPDRKIDVVFFYDGRHSVRLWAKLDNAGRYRQTTTPIGFTDVTGMLRAISYESARKIS
jgi:hypothetical protein